MQTISALPTNSSLSRNLLAIDRGSCRFPSACLFALLLRMTLTVCCCRYFFIEAVEENHVSRPYEGSGCLGSCRRDSSTGIGNSYRHDWISAQDRRYRLSIRIKYRSCHRICVQRSGPLRESYGPTLDPSRVLLNGPRGSSGKLAGGPEAADDFPILSR